jgi:hypothetical protein
MDHVTTSGVAIIGAGPYALSIAAHLRSEDVDFRIFGIPIHCWQSHMPKGMLLKSEGWASNLFDAAGNYTLKQYCAEHGLAYAQIGTPVSLEVFTKYALSFQQRLVPAVENVLVTALERLSNTFKLRLSSGETLKARNVVVATGMSYTACVPSVLARLPEQLVSHSSNHDDLTRFTGREVTVIGAGQSALESAALLHEAGVDVHLVVRRSSIAWNGAPQQRGRSLGERLRPTSKLGPGFGPWLYVNAPMLFRYLPVAMRIARAKNALGPAGAWWLKERVVGRLPVMLGHSVRGAEIQNGRVVLDLQGPDGKLSQLTTDHVIAATGYRFALSSLPFLSHALLSQLHSIQQTPVLSPNFESSVPGLYFTGLASANQFGPAMRFLPGADYTARRVSRHIAGRVRRFSSPAPVVPRRAETCEGS